MDIPSERGRCKPSEFEDYLREDTNVSKAEAQVLPGLDWSNWECRAR
jgi:hypothetical protein